MWYAFDKHGLVIFKMATSLDTGESELLPQVPHVWDHSWCCLLLFIYALAVYTCLKYTIVKCLTAL